VKGLVAKRSDSKTAADWERAPDSPRPGEAAKTVDPRRAAEFPRAGDKNDCDGSNGRAEEDSCADRSATAVSCPPAVAPTAPEAPKADEIPRPPKAEAESRWVGSNTAVREARGTAGGTEAERPGRTGQNSVTQPAHA
jgi:hypothetical protein